MAIRVSDLITEEEINNLNKGDTITVTAGTGAGKIYFVKNGLYDEAKGEGKKILMLVHRLNCKNQFSYEIMRDNKANVIDITFRAKKSAINIDTPFTTIKGDLNLNGDISSSGGAFFKKNIQTDSDIKMAYNKKLHINRFSTQNFPDGDRYMDLINQTWNRYKGVALRRTSSGSKVFLGMTRSALLGNKTAHIEVGHDSKNYVRFTDIFNRTYSDSSNMYVTSYGTLGRTTSASKYKVSIEDQFKDENKQLEHSKKILDLDVASWFDKSQSEIYAEECDTGESRSDDVFKLQRHVGLIAEHVEKAGLSEHVAYGDEGEVEGIEYDRLWIHVIPILKEQQKENKHLKEKIKRLEVNMKQLLN